MTSSDLRALAQLVDDRKVVVVRHENLLAVLKPEAPPRARRAGTITPVQDRSEGVPEVSSPIPPDLAASDGSPITTAIQVTSVEEPPRFELGNGGFAELCTR